MTRINALHLRVFGMFAVAFTLCGIAYAYSLMGHTVQAVASMLIAVVLGLGIVRAGMQTR